MRARNPERIRAKREKLEAELRALQEQEREQDEHRAAVVGRAVLAEAEQDPAFRDQLTALLERSVSAAKERKLLALPTVSRRGRRRPAEPVATPEVLDLERGGRLGREAQGAK